MVATPIVKFFAGNDQSIDGIVECVRIDRPVGSSLSQWLGWGKVMQLLGELHP